MATLARTRTVSSRGARDVESLKLHRSKAPTNSMEARIAMPDIDGMPRRASVDAMRRRARAVEITRRAAADPSRPGEECKAVPGTWRPIVNQSACEGKRDCVDVCPYDVFEVHCIDAADFKGLGLLAQIKIRVHGMQMAYTPRADECRACGLCVVACPEDAIRIERIP